MHSMCWMMRCRSAEILEIWQQEAYVLHEKLDMDYAPRKIALPEEMEKKEYFLIVKHHIDTNHHVNNGQYVQMAMELLPDDFRISQMRAEYKKAALLGDMVGIST